MSKNLIVTMSGGTTTVINSTLSGIISEVKKSKEFDKVYAGFPGIEGILNDQVVDLTVLSDLCVSRLKHTPGSAAIGTTRVAVLSKDKITKIRDRFEYYGIKAHVNIGGNGTIKQTRQISAALSSDFMVAAAPKTVDNDLGDAACEDVFFTPGFPSCVNHWVKTLQLLNIENLGACTHDKVLVAQTFGRETGFLAGAARMVDPERQIPLVILLPEDQQPLNKVIDHIDDTVRRHGRALVVTSEGYTIGNMESVFDKTGQVMYGSGKTTAAQLLVDALINSGITARSYIPTVLQRQCIEDTMEFDLDIAELQGRYIVNAFERGESSFLATVKKPQGSSYKNDLVDQIPFSSFSNYSRRLKDEFFNPGGFDVSDEYIKYLNFLFSVSKYEQSYGFEKNRFLMPHEICRNSDITLSRQSGK